MASITEAFANFAKNRNVAAQVVTGTASSLTTDLALSQVNALVAAGKLLSVTVTGQDNIVSAINMAKMVAMPKFALGAGATFEVKDSAANILSNMASLTKATKFTVSGANTVSIANAITLVGKLGFNLFTGATFVVTGSATDILAATASVAKTKATSFTVSTATAAQAKTLAAFTQFTTSGNPSSITVVEDTATAILAMESGVLAEVSSVKITGPNALTVAQATSLGAKPLSLATGATLVISGNATDLLGITSGQTSPANLAKSLAKATGVTLTGANSVTVANANALTAKTGFSLATGATLAVSGAAETLLTASSATLSKATEFKLTGANSISIANATTLLGAKNFKLDTSASLNVSGLLADVTNADNAKALSVATSITVTDAAITAAAANTLVSTKGLNANVKFVMTVADTAENLVGDKYTAVAKATSVKLSEDAIGVTVADAMKLANLSGFNLNSKIFAITGTVDDLLATGATAALALATTVTVTGTDLEVSAAEADRLAALGATLTDLTSSQHLKIVDSYANLNVAGLDLTLAEKVTVTDRLSITQALALVDDGDKFSADAAWTFSEVTGAVADLVDADNADLLDLADKVTLSEPTDVAIADAITLAGLNGFNLGDNTLAITGSYATLSADGAAAAVALATAISVTDASLTAAHAATLFALNETAMPVLAISDRVAGILNADYATVVMAAAEAGTLTFSDEETLTVAQALTLVDYATSGGKDLSDIFDGNDVTIGGSATEILDNKVAFSAATKFAATTATVDEAVELQALATDDLEISVDVIADTAAALVAVDPTDLPVGAVITLVGVENVISVEDLGTLTTNCGDFGTTSGKLHIAAGATLVIADTWDNIKVAIADLQTLADDFVNFLSIELTEGSVTLSMTDYAASSDAIALLVGKPAIALTIEDSDEAVDLTALDNAALANVSSISAANATDDLTINVSDQTEGFSITGGTGNDAILGGGAANTIGGGDGDDSITGGAGADSITGGGGNDTINGFAGADTLVGGADNDTLILAAGANADLANASDAALATVEFVTGHATATTINLSKQTEAFTITGGAQADIITGGAGNDTIDGAAGADVITGGAGNDSITGGAGNDSISGGAGADVFVGFAGTDTLVGGDGVDKLTLAAEANTDLAAAVDTAISGVETIEGAATATTINLSKQTEAFTITGGAEADIITGGAGNDTISGAAGANVITGGAGADSITGGGDDDTINYFVGADTVVGGGGNDTLVLAAGANADLANASDAALATVEFITGAATASTINLSKQTDAFTIVAGAEADTITGGAGNDTIDGAAGADVITGGVGNDSITGGTGNDIINGFNTGDIVNGGLDTDTLVLAASITTSSTDELVDVEIVSAATLTAATTINLTGQTEGFKIIGASGANTITGGAGNDTITVGAGASSILGGAGNDTITGGAGNDSITGGDGVDSLTGGAGSDTFTGFGAGDTVLGGDGSDTLVLTSGTDFSAAEDGNIQTVEIVAGAATATTINTTKQSEAFIINGGAEGDTITAGIKNDTINGGGGDDSINGGQGADSISGGDGADTITGFVGADTVIGGAGSDTLVLLAGANTDIANATDAALATVESITGAATATTINLSKQSDSFTITGGDEADTIIGGGGNDTINGGNGNNVITGGAGNDSITGGTGNDIINGFNTGDKVDGGAGTADTLVLTSSITTSTDGELANLEIVSAASLTVATTIILTGQVEAFTILGGAGADKITGGGGNDMITGGAGADSITGGAGNDTINYFVGADTVIGGDNDDTLVLAAGANTELANASDAALATVEFITGAATATTINLSKQSDSFTITGGAEADTITGGAGNDTIDGAVGADVIAGGAGNDSISGGAGNDIINGFNAGDIVNGGAGTDTLVLAASITTSANSELVDLEIVSAATLTVATTINLTGQTEEGLTIIGGSGNDTITGGTGAETIKGGAGADVINGGLTGVNTFDYTTLTNSLVASFDTIGDFKATDKFKIGHTVVTSAFKTLDIASSSALATDLANSTRAASFVANGATVVTVAAGSASGRYLVINDASAAFSASADAVIKLAGTATVANTNFIA